MFMRGQCLTRLMTIQLVHILRMFTYCGITNTHLEICGRCTKISIVPQTQQKNLNRIKTTDRLPCKTQSNRPKSLQTSSEELAALDDWKLLSKHPNKNLRPRKQ